MKGTRGEPVDKYEQILAKYDWHNPRPPSGYVYGVGRGAKAFVTSGELTSGLTLSTLGKPTREENDFFAALDRVEEKPTHGSGDKRTRQRNREDGKRTDDDEHGSSSSGAVQKLSLDDLAAFNGLGATSGASTQKGDKTMSTTAAASSTAAQETPAASGAGRAGGFLTTRNARNEAVENAEEYLFSDERGLTMHDLLRGKHNAAQHNLLNILEMGSPDEQGTWITHARALREMGLAKKAQQTLQEGCARTGKRGPLIWQERLAYVAAHDVAVRRRILEEAAEACPGEEGLWLQLLSCQPPHERISCLQRAVIACPQSEALWLRVVDAVPAARDQKRIVTQALQRSQDLPLLWAKLARLEASYEMGKQIFHAAAQRYPSLALVLEAAKFAEWSAHRTGGGAPPPVVRSEEAEAASRQRLREMHRAVEDTVKAAARQYLDLTEGSSRSRWMQAAQEMCRCSSEHNMVAPTEEGAISGSGGGGAGGVGVLQRYVWTAAYMFVECLLPAQRDEARGRAVPLTWLEDLLAMTDEPFTQHGTLCALWATWLLLEKKRLLPPSSSLFHENKPQQQGRFAMAAPAGVFPAPVAHPWRGAGGDEGDGVPWLVVDVLRATVRTAPDSALQVAIDTILVQESFARLLTKPAHTGDGKSEPVKQEGVVDKGTHEEEEEELARPARQPVQSAASLVAVKKEEPQGEEEAAGGQRMGTITAATGATEAAMPLPFSVVLRETLSFIDEPVADGPRGRADASRPPQRLLRAGSTSRLTLALAKALFTRRQYRAALLLLQLAQHATSPGRREEVEKGLQARTMTAAFEDTDAEEEEEEAADALVAATAKCFAALGMHTEADACLQQAIDSKVAARQRTGTSTTTPFRSDLLWVKLAVHRRSGLGVPCDLEAFLAEATSLQRCPRSVRLWLMRLEAVRGRLARSLELPSDAADASAPVPVLPSFRVGKGHRALSPAQLRELRTLYEQALSLSHCPHSAEVWAFVALRIEAELFHAAATARARLLDAAIACGANVIKKGGYSRATAGGAGDAAQQRQQQQLMAAVTLGVAHAKVELLHAGTSQALEVVRETLQQLPKSSDGTFTVPVGELLQLFIDLEVPAARGRAAAQVMRQWKSREPLALLSVAKVYHAAGQHAKALDQAVRAATEGDSTTVHATATSAAATAGHRGAHSESRSMSNGWGDCAALLWRMAHRAEYRVAVAQRMGMKLPDFGEATAPPLREAEIRAWLLQVLGGESGTEAVREAKRCSASGNGESAKPSANVKAEGKQSDEKMEEEEDGEEERVSTALSLDALHFNRGPLWIQVAKAQDPTNVTLLGYRDSVEAMLQRTADLLGV